MTEARVLTAMAHPLRRRLLDVLRVHGPATASVLAERTAQAVGNISHHMRILAEAGLAEEAPELARDRRERWWRRVPGSITWSVEHTDEPADAAAEAVGRAAESLNLEHQFALARRWLDVTGEENDRWPEGPFSTDAWLRVTPAELRQFGDELMALVFRWADREIPDDGQERFPVFAFARGVPAEP
jgi:DNA-binding transcriptional ArsR family regulator